MSYFTRQALSNYRRSQLAKHPGHDDQQVHDPRGRWWRGGALEAGRPMYFSDDSETANYFARGTGGNNTASEYEVSVNRTATVADRNKVLREANAAGHRQANGEEFFTGYRTASYVDAEEMAHLKRAGFDSIRGPQDNMTGNELAVFDLPKVKLKKQNNGLPAGWKVEKFNDGEGFDGWVVIDRLGMIHRAFGRRDT